MRRLVLVPVALALMLGASPPAGAQDAPPPPPAPVNGATPPASSAPTPGNTKPSWAKEQIGAVVAAGLMAPSVDGFRPDDALTRGELAELLAGLGATSAIAGDPSAAVKVRELDAALVRALGLGPTAAAVRASLAAAGLKPPARAGTEVVARMLALRTNHPESDDGLEPGPSSPVTRAETAYSVARVLELRAARAAAAVASPASSLTLPELSEWQRRVLSRAVRFVGYPYVWGGSSERAQAPFGVTVPGGFDCSGLVWRVYKLEAFDGAPGLGEVLKGRTTYVMSAEGPARIPLAEVQPGDLLFFGDAGTSSKPSQVGHMGIALGNGWFIHGSTRGVTISQLTGWYLERFAWARRPLAEAGLA